MHVKYFLKIFVVAMLLVTASAIEALDKYVSAPEEVYKWEQLEDATMKTDQGNTRYVLNVTSLSWLDASRAYSVSGTVWTHLVEVIVPKELKIRNVSNAYITNGDNRKPNDYAKETDRNLYLGDVIARYTGQVGVVIHQIPNTPIIFPNDPEQIKREEDDILAWGWKEFLNDPNLDPEWLPRLPMTKASFQCMRAAQEFLASKDIADPKGWSISGASKRGWTTWDMGAVRCSNCPKILGIVPTVGIVPNILPDVHRMWKSYGGFTWAFDNYARAGTLQYLDTPAFKRLTEVIDPIEYLDRLKEIPKLIIVSSNDEFMMFDWTNLYYDQIQGEKHLMIAPNTEHSMATNLWDVLSSTVNFMRSVGHGIDSRPSFNYTYNRETGEITVQMLQSNKVKPKKVSLRYAETLTTQRRDFRLIFQTNEKTEPCKWPYIPLSFNYNDDPNKEQLCIAPIYWYERELKETSPGFYKALPPQPKDGHWTGYFIEVVFPGDLPKNSWIFPNQFVETTPGWTWPDTFPFDDIDFNTAPDATTLLV